MCKRRSCLLLTVVLIVLLIGGGLALAVLGRGGLNALEAVYLRVWLSGQEAELNAPAGGDGTLRVFEVAAGDTAAMIGDKLLAAELITDAELFRNYAAYNGLDSQLQAGTYFLAQTQTIPEIARALTDSGAASVTVRILEGWRMEEIAQVIDQTPLLLFSGADFLAAVGPGAEIPADFAAYVSLPEGVALEGFLYPDTYYVPPAATAADFRNTLLSTFLERVGTDLKAAAEQQGWTLYQAVTLASIVEREAVHADEEAQIASVYRNRITAGMTLDADPTVQYGIGYRGGSWWPTITQDDYRTALSPYNTYLNAGLPPGPIANPNRAAVVAAIFPAETPYYYFRATCAADGYHVFAITFDEHVANGVCQ